METRKIRIYFDFGCPFCYNQWSFMKKIRDRISIEEDYYSWEIHPTVPEAGAPISYPDHERKAVLLNKLGAAVGVAPGDMKTVYNTRKALQILELAKEQNLQLEYMDAVFKAYFEDKVNVGLDEVILPIAEKVNIQGAAEVLAQGKYVDTILAHDKHCLDINLEFVPTIEEKGQIILSGVLSLKDLEREFLK